MSVAAQGSTEFVRRGPPLLSICPSARWRPLDLGETWRFRDLLLSLATRDLKLRYKQTALGIVWVLVQPLLAAGIFGIVFGMVAKLPTDDVPPFLFAYTGLLGFNLFNNTVVRASACLLGNQQLITKVFFPRLILPLSTVPSVLVDFAVAAGLMVVLMAGYHHSIHTSVGALLLLPVWVVLTLLMSLGIGLCASALTVQYRDVQYILPVALQMLQFASPIAYAITKVSSPTLKLFFMVNPLTGLIQAFDWSLLGAPVPPPSAWSVAYAAVVGGVLIVAGAFGFKRMERMFADVI